MGGISLGDVKATVEGGENLGIKLEGEVDKELDCKGSKGPIRGHKLIEEKYKEATVSGSHR